MTKKEEKKKKRYIILILLLLFLLILVIGGVGWFLYYNSEPARIQREVDAENGFLPGMSDEEIKDRLNQRLAEGYFNISINATPTYEDGNAAGDIRIENVINNHYSFTVSVDVIDASENPGAQEYVGKTILTTGLITPGSYVENKKLDEPIPKGQYLCIATFSAYDSEEKYAGAVGTQIVINVEN